MKSDLEELINVQYQHLQCVPCTSVPLKPGGVAALLAQMNVSQNNN